MHKYKPIWFLLKSHAKNVPNESLQDLKHILWNNIEYIILTLVVSITIETNQDFVTSVMTLWVDRVV